jgi:hypothetical protein
MPCHTFLSSDPAARKGICHRTASASPGRPTTRSGSRECLLRRICLFSSYATICLGIWTAVTVANQQTNMPFPLVGKTRSKIGVNSLWKWIYVDRLMGNAEYCYSLE